MSGQIVNSRVAAYAAEIVAALEPLRSRDCGFGEFYVSEVTIGFDGENAGVWIVADEFGGLSIKVDGNEAA